jgi:hypothetical protein
MKKLIITFIGFLLGISLPMRGQPGIPFVVGMGGHSDSLSVTYTIGQPYVANHHNEAGFENILTLPKDTLFAYKIGAIPDKVVYHNSVCRFRFFRAGNPSAVYSYQVTDRYDTTIIIEQEDTSAVFQYDPLSSDFSPFLVEFIAMTNEDTLTQQVRFTPLPDLFPEQDILRYMHSEITFDTILMNQTWKTGEPMNFTSDNSLATIDLIGKTVVFENGTTPFAYDMPSLARLNIFATTVIVRDAVRFPQSEVYLFCENLIFEDTGPEHSCFITIPRTPGLNVSEKQGLRGGDFHCYAKNVTAPGKHVRFYLNGGTGSAENQATGADPGGGGDAGDFYSNLNLKAYVHLKGGFYQKPYDWENNYPLGPRGEDGNYIFESQPYKWLHPNAVRLMLQFARERYIYGQDEATLETCERYIGLISSFKNTPHWDTDTVSRLDLEQLLYSFASVKEQLENDLDYYGNPRGWAPLLSFEANLQNYENEIEYAIRVFYLNYWLSTKATDLQDLLDGAWELKEQNAAEIERLQQIYAKASAEFGPNLLQFQTMSDRLDSITFVYDSKIEELLQKAKDKVADSWESKLRKVGFIAGQVCKFIPGPVTQVLGSGLQTAAAFDYEDPLSMENWSKVHETLSLAFNEFSTVADNASGAIGGMNPASIATAAGKQAMHNCEVVLENLAPENLMKIGPAIKQLTIPDSKVKAEFERLKAATPILEVWTDTMEYLSIEKGYAAQRLSFNRYQLTAVPREITKLLLACDAMDDIIIGNENVVDPRALSYLNEMKNSAWERMLKYHYYLAMAYQYRFLEPYEQPLNMQPLFESFDTLAVHHAELSPSQYQALLPVFQDQLKQITDELYDQFNTGTYNEFNAPVRYTLNADQLEELNINGKVNINIWEEGKIPLQNADYRVTDIDIDPAVLNISQDTILSDASLTMLFAHSGRSVLINQKDGQHFLFSQYNKDASVYYETDNIMTPLGWGEKYFFVNQELNPITRSQASQSLLRKILDYAGDDDFMVFTRPSAWSDIRISTDLFKGEQAEMQFSIDAMTLIIYTDYKPVTTFSNILVNTSDGLMPLIRCSQPDRNGRYHGWGNFTRSYDKMAASVSFTAPEEYGIYKFDRWVKTVNSGYEEIPYHSVSVNPANHTMLTAHYRLNVPKLDVPDTLYASWSQTSLDVPVQNQNVMEHLAMDWFSETSSEWFSIKEGTDTGKEDGSITLQFSSNEGELRTGTVKVYAFDASNPEKEVVIIQGTKVIGIQPGISAGNSLVIYPVPASQEIRIDLPEHTIGKQCIISIFTMEGRTVYSQEWTPKNSPEHTVGISTLSPGVYILKAIIEGEVYIQKFIKN